MTDVDPSQSSSPQKLTPEQRAWTERVLALLGAKPADVSAKDSPPESQDSEALSEARGRIDAAARKLGEVEGAVRGLLGEAGEALLDELAKIGQVLAKGRTFVDAERVAKLAAKAEATMAQILRDARNEAKSAPPEPVSKSAPPTEPTEMREARSAEDVETEERDRQDNAKALKAALAALTTRRKLVEKMKIDAEAALGTLSAGLTALFKKILDPLTALASETDPAAIERGIEATEADTAKAEADIKTLTGKRAAYLPKLAEAEAAIAALEAHTKKSRVATGLATQKENLRKAKEDHGAKHEYDQAMPLLDTVIAECPKLEATADAAQKYAIVLSDREGRVTALTNPSGLAPVTAKIDAVKQKLQAAKTAATAKNYVEAVKLLDELPQLCIDANWMSQKADEYSWKHQARKDQLDDLRTKEIPEVKPWIDEFERLWRESDYATTGDYVVSVRKLVVSYGMKSDIEDRIKAVKEARDAVKELDDKITAFKALDGAKGIEGEIARQTYEKNYATQKIDRSEWIGAKAIVANAKKQWPAIEKKAQEYKAFEDYLKPVKTEYDRIAALPGAAAIVAKLNAIHDLIEKGEALAKASKLADARAAVVQARQLLPEAHYLALKAEATGGPGMPAVTYPNDKAEADALVAKLDTLIASIKSDGNASHGRYERRDAEAHRAEAVKARDAATPDYAKAKSEARDGIDDALLARRAIDERVSWLDARADYWATRRLAENTDNVVKKERDDAKAIWVQAKAEITRPKRNYAQSHQLIKNAIAMLKKAAEISALYKTYKAELPAAETAVTEVKDDPRAAGIPTFSATMQSDLQKAKDHAKLDKREFKEALAILADLVKRAPALKQMMTLYSTCKTYRDNNVTVAHFDPFKNKKIIEGEYKAALDGITAAQAKFDARQYQSAYRMFIEVSWRKRPMREVLAAYNDYTATLGLVTPEFEELTREKTEAVEADHTRFKAAIEQAAAIITGCEGGDEDPRKVMKVDEAHALIKPLLEPIKAAVVRAKAHKLYKPVLESVETEIAGLGKLANADAIDLRIAEFGTRVETAKKLAATGNYDGARVLLQTIPADIQKAKDHAAAHAEFADAAKGAADTLKDADETALGTELEKAKGLFAKIKGHKGAEGFGGEVAAIEAQLGKAEAAITGKKLAEARKLLEVLFFRLSQAHVRADRWVQFDVQAVAARQALAEVRSHEHASLVDAMLKTIGVEIDLAVENARNDFFDQSTAEIIAARALCEKALAGAKAHTVYLAARTPLDTRRKAIMAHRRKFCVNEQLDRIEALFAEADAKAAALDHAAATKLLDEIEGLLDLADLRIKMQGNHQPTEQELKDLIGRPDGIKLLDKLVADLDPKAKRKVVHDAFELRFGVDLKMQTAGEVDENTPDAKAPNIMKLYEIFANVPDKYTRDSRSMKVVKRVGEDVGTSSFWAVDKSIELKVGRADEKNEKTLADPLELPNVDATCKPTGDAAPKFNWTTLHEIAHSIDDRTGFMASNGKDTKYGGWKQHGGDVSEIASAAAEEFGYDSAYIESYLQKGAGSYPIPAPPHPDKATDWERARVNAETWCDAIRKDKSIWYNDSECAKRAIKGRVYQESYGNDWTSYLYSARSQGVTGYQFRAPGEWFSEIYAAFHTNKLPGSHPATKWLGQFGEPKK